MTDLLSTVDEPDSSEYTVVARRYRPQQFRELIGQSHVAQSLINALNNNRVAHAYLFTGARGVGKTSAARILAKALNCENGPTPNPCDRCSSCRLISTGDDIDVLEIDGASNRRIEEIRDIRINVQLKPSRSRHKIYIIDEVHMLTREAFNALLKTLEEPPAGVKFIFATTEVHKVPITILSRCQRFDFALIAPALICDHLKKIVKQETIEADDEALDLLARRAAGSMRDAESLLDQLMAYGERISVKLVHTLLGTAPAERVFGIADAIFSGNAGAALSALDGALAEGVQIGEFLDQLIEVWRDLMLLASCRDVELAKSHSLAKLGPLLEKTSLDAVLAGLDLLATAKSRLKFTSHGRVVVEVALVRLARLDQILSVGEIWSMVQGGSTGPAARPTAATPTAPTLTTPAEKKKTLNRTLRLPSP